MTIKHPALLGIGLALLLAVASLTALRHFATREPPAAGAEGVAVGQVWQAALPDLAGKSQPLAQWQGKVLVLNFWAPWCPPCREEIPGFLRLQEKHGARGVQFVGIALDDLEKVRAYVDESGIDYPILLGGMEGVTLSRAAGNRLGGLPYTVIFDRRGNAVTTLTGGVAESRMEGLILPLL